MTPAARDARSLEEFFRLNEPEVVLISYASHHASFQLLDIDEYRIGFMVCEEVAAMCMPTRWQSFDHLSIHRKGDLPEQFSWLSSFIGDYLLLVLRPTEDEDDPLLPLLGDRRLAYVICKSVKYVQEPYPGR